MFPLTPRSDSPGFVSYNIPFSQKSNLACFCGAVNCSSFVKERLPIAIFGVWQYSASILAPFTPSENADCAFLPHALACILNYEIWDLTIIKLTNTSRMVGSSPTKEPLFGEDFKTMENDIGSLQIMLLLDGEGTIQNRWRGTFEDEVECARTRMWENLGNLSTDWLAVNLVPKPNADAECFTSLQ
jgi:hypothetical protein